MPLRKFLSSLGSNGPHAETRLDRSAIRPGRELGLSATVRGGAAPTVVNRLALGRCHSPTSRVDPWLTLRGPHGDGNRPSRGPG
ncbi:sporulation protein [Streptomyces sp. NBC_01643]|uniref:sporulation protein n=1 Tax=Streptomyces sp. NBC_01643 TaxID=2975906 RepID=UPI00386CE2C3